MSFLYEMTFPNGKRYIGITQNAVEKRFSEHAALSRTKGGNLAVSNALRKYGPESVISRVIAEIEDWELLCLAEQEAISLFGTRSPAGYNLTDGGEGTQGHRHSAEARKKIADKRALQTSPFKGRHWTDEQKQQMALKRRGVPLHDEKTKRKIGMAAARNKYAKGYRHTEEAKKKISEANRLKTYKRGRKASPESIRKRSASMRARWANPCFSWRQSVALATAWAVKQGRPMSYIEVVA